MARSKVGRRASDGRKSTGDEVRAARRSLAAAIRAKEQAENSVEARLGRLGLVKARPRIFKPGDEDFEVPA